MSPAILMMLACGAIAALVAAALAWPLRRPSPRLFAALVVLVPALAIVLYQVVGTPAGLDERPRTRVAAEPPTLEEAIANLEADLARDPRQPEGWRLLGRGYARQGDANRARDAYVRAAGLAPDNDDVLVEYAEARALADPGRRFDDTATGLLRQVVARTPRHQRARWFLGIAQRQAGDSAAAAATWEPLLADVDAGAAAALRPQIDAARADAGLPALPPAPATAGSTPAGTATAGIAVRVALAPGFSGRAPLPADATVFVIARVPGGPPMPVAVERRSVGDLPFEVVLDDGDSPMPTQVLSTLREVEVFARVSASGDATPGDDDVMTGTVRVALPADGPVELVLGADAQ